MSWDDIRQRVLNPVEGVVPHDTSAYGATTNRPPSSSNPHRGVDFNYLGGQTTKFNQSHPALRSPVDGVVENAGEGTVGRIAIRDGNGFLHEILHTHTRNVSVGDPVVAGQLIGTMGNTGVPNRSDGKPGDQHVHYQLKDPAGNGINPTAFWNQRGPADANPDPPAYLDAYQQYTRGFGGSAGSGSGNIPGVVSAPDIRSLGAPSNEIMPMYARETRSLGRRVTGQSFFKTGVPAVPVVPANPVLSRDRSNSFADRFGTWTSSADGIASDNSNQAAAQPGGQAVTSIAPERYLSRRIVGAPQVSVFDIGAPPVTSLRPNDAVSPGRPAAFNDRFGDWTALPDGGIAPRNPNLPVLPPEAARPLGIVSGQPMPQWITPPPIFGQPDRSKAPVDDAQDWLTRMIQSLGSS